MPISYWGNSGLINDDPIVSHYITTSPPGIADSAERLRMQYSNRSPHGCILFGERAVSLPELPPKVTRQFHVGNPGISRTKALARSYAYWLDMDKQLEQLHSDKLHHNLGRPLRLHGQRYTWTLPGLYTWPKVILIPTIETGSTILQLRGMLSRFRCPTMLVGDSGTQFTSSVFADSSRENNIDHSRTLLYHHQSNSQAKCFFNTFQNYLPESSEETIAEILETFVARYQETANPQTQWTNFSRGCHRAENPTATKFHPRIYNYGK
ncbi:uncharacterized protein DEA37_0011425 [Paragonimus westermani]|uniref:Integrase catalytic domain-containing protein n=1 Tax=Paragonimus westermani TaxID=34504 RepID=A0A5J4NEA2_9TREM|nr:uncharacterized protein DEA37_0011425 [Paragonimus westermani]